MRKFLIGFISLGIVLFIFLVYNYINQTPSTDSGVGTEYIDTVIDSNFAGAESDIGKIGDMGVGTIRKAVYTTLNKNKEVEREWGFERLLHQAEEMWEIEKPFMNIFEQDFKCYITADKGEVKIETIADKPTPKDATFTGNVVVHIVPNGSSNIKESHIYLDDIAFISERSQLATAGPVRFVSEDAQMLGTGLELVYNDQLERLELFRIVRLESLRIKSSQMAFLSSITEPAESTTESTDSVEAADQSESQPLEETVIASAAESLESQPSETTTQEVPSQAVTAQAEQNDGDYYRCIFNRNVIIDTPEQLIFARDSLSISNLFWSKAKTKEPDKVATETASGITEPVIEINETDVQIAVGSDANFPAANFIDTNSIFEEPVNTIEVADSQQSEPNEPEQQFVDIIVTCDEDVVLVPKDYPWPPSQSTQSETEISNSIAENIKTQDNSTGRTLFFAKTIDYSVTTGDVVTEGLTELTLYTNNMDGTEPNQATVPLMVTARQGAKFLQGQSKVIFEGDCLCTMPQTGLSEQRNAKLSARMITVNVPKDESRNVLVSSDVIAAGPVNLEFYMQDSRIRIDPNDPNNIVTEPILVPVKVDAREQATFMPASNRVIFEGDCVCTMPQKGLTPSKDCTFTSPQLTINLNKTDSKLSSAIPDISAAGPAKFAFYLKDLAGTDVNKAPLPAKVTAQNQAYFSAETNKIVFEGDCLGTTVRQDPNSSQEYSFSAPRLTIDLHKESNNQSSEMTAGIKHFKADGGTVRLWTIKTAKTEPVDPVPDGQEAIKGTLLAGMELKCRKFDYDPNSQLLMATGPGMITIDNSKITEPEGDVGRFSLRQPSYGFLKNFDTLKYYMDTKKIVADARPPGLLINYIPVVNGKYDDDVFATTSHVEAYLSETSEGKVELSTLIASDGVYFIDVNRRNEFIGSKLFYDHKNSLIRITGDESQPCNCNGALVDEIIYDLITGVIEAQVVAPGAL